ncbi:MAG: transglycosylase SLT domain-containing protein [Bdellovibrionota bacterium]
MKFSFTKSISLGIAVVFLSSNVMASLQPVQMNFQKEVPQTRWIFDKKAKDLKPAYKSLAQLKNSQITRNFSACQSQGKAAYASNKILRPWILSVQYDCELNGVNSKKSGVAQLRVLNGLLKGQPDWLLRGPYKDKLKSGYVDSHFAILEWEIRNRPQLAWSSVGELLDIQDWMNPEQKARAFQMAGELSFLQQNLLTAKAYILKSLVQKDDVNLRDKLKAIESALLFKKDKDQDTAAEEKPLLVNLGQEEQKIVERMTGALKSGDLFSATQDGMELIEEYPGSLRADWATQRISESYQSISQQDEKQFKVLRYDFINVMKRADSKRLLDWAKRAYRTGQYKDAADLAEEAYTKSKGDIASVEIVDLLAKSTMHNKDFGKAQKYFKEVTEKYSGTKESVDAYFYLGMMQYIDKNYSKAISNFEKVISQLQYSDLELMARYWLWRTAQKTDSQRAQVEVQILIQKFPFSYYGLRAVAELNKGEVSFGSLKKKLTQKQDIWLSPQEKLSWDRFQTLSAAGWYEEANLELNEIPVPENPEGIAMLARHYAAAFNYPKAISMLNKAWDENSALRNFSLLQTAYPKEFEPLIIEQANIRKVDPKLVMSLIRQESSFNVFAVSSSSAYGLMQMIPPTAKEIATALKIKNLEIPTTLFDPETNIRMGTYYFAKMITDFGNNVPFALAAYNAGPTRLKRWMQSSGISPQLTSSPEYEVWVDLLPWNETRFYVKAILRNYLIYQLIDSSKVQVKDPVWVNSTAQSSTPIGN